MAWVTAFLFSGAFVAVSVAGLLLVQRWVPLQVRQQHNEVAGFVYAVVGVIYGVLLALAVILVWERYEAAETRVAHEAALLTDLYRDAPMLDPSGGGEVRAALRAYAELVVASEWSAMAMQQPDAGTGRAFDGIWAALGRMQPEGDTQEAWYGEALARLGDVGELRMLRLEGSRGGIPQAIWPPLLLGAMAVIGFCYFFGAANNRAHVLMVIALVIVISLSLFLVWALENPYRGAVTLESDPFDVAMDRFDELDAASGQ